MAPRLIRWGVATGLGFVGVLVATLPPGPSPLERGYLRWDEPTRDPLGGALHSVQGALSWAKFGLSAAEQRGALQRAAPFRRSPIVVRMDSGRLAVDERMTRRAEEYWRRATVPSGATRSILVAGAGDVTGEGQELDSVVGACVILLPHPYATGRQRDVIGSAAGRCLLQARFGPPGPGVRSWLDSANHLVIPERAPRVATTPESSSDAQQWPEWAVSDGSGRPGWDGWSRSREALACAAGRTSHCVAAVGLAARSDNRPRRAYYDRRLFSELPAALLEELGPDRFQELWRGEEAIPVAFARLSGAPFEPWVASFVQRRTGKLVRPTALGVGGWVGWIFWIGLLTGWLAIRLRSSPAR